MSRLIRIPPLGSTESEAQPFRSEAMGFSQKVEFNSFKKFKSFKTF